MAIDAKLVLQLREMTGAGMMDAKRALEETGGDLEKASEELRKKGIVKAAKRAERVTKEGRVHAYIHGNGKIGVLVEVLCETDFVARNEAFIELCHDLALHISAFDPLYVSREDVPPEVIEKEKEIYAAELNGQNKPADVIEKIVQGKLDKWFTEVTLLAQPFVKDDTKTVDEVIKERIATLGENIQVRRFCRFKIG